MSKQPRRLVQEPTLSNTAPMMVCAAVLLTVLAVYFFIVNSQSWLLFAAVMCVAVAALIVGLVSWVGFNRDRAIYADYLAERDDVLRHNDAVVERERAGVTDDDVILSQDPVESVVDWDDPKYAVDDETNVTDEYPQRKETSPAAALVGAAGAAGTAAVAVEDTDDPADEDAVEFEQAPEEPAATTLMDEADVTESDVDEAVADEGDEGVLFGDDEVGQIDSEGASDPVLDEFFAAEDTDLPADEYAVEDTGSSLIDLDTEAGTDVDTEAGTDADTGVDTEADADTGVDTEAVADVDTEAGTDVDTEAGTDVDTEADADTGAAVDTEADEDTEADVDTEAGTESVAAVDTGVDTGVDTEAEADVDTEADTKDEPEPSLGGFSLLGFTDEETK